MKTTLVKSILMVSLAFGVSAETFANDDAVDYTSATFFGSDKAMSSETTMRLKTNAFDSVNAWRRANDSTPAVPNFGKSRATDRSGSVSNPLIMIGLENNR